MTLVLNQSDIYLIRSGEHAKCFVRSPAQTAPPADPWSAPDRADRAWFTDRDLQALRPTQLSLRRWTWTRPQAISVHNCANRRSPAAWLRAECSLRPSRGVPCQLPQATGDAQRDLRNQCRTSAPSAAGCPALFAGFAGIISESDFFAPFIIGYGLRPSRCGPGTASQDGDEDIPVPAQEVCVHAEGLTTTRGGEGPCDIGPAPVAFCLPRRHRHPGLHCLRRSIPRLYVPLSTLRVLPHSSVPRMTRGQRGSVLLHCDGLAPSTSCRSPGAPRLNGWPMPSPTDASSASLRTPTHGSGPMWIATPSS